MARSFCVNGAMFHLELRQFPHVARAFNLSREELDTRFARPWVSGTAIQHQDRRWAPERARLTIYEGPALRPDEIGLGRGWATVGKTAREVTETVLGEAQRGAGASQAVQTFTAVLIAEAATSLPLGDVVILAAREYPQWRPSEQLALAEQAVWEMLHHRQLTLTRGGAAVDAEDWRAVLLSWGSWSGDSSPQLLLETPG
jgi:hypothetical protein